MKKINLILIILTSFLSCGEPPTQFTEAVLNDTFLTLDDSSIEFKSVLKAHSGKKIVINVWASWCQDCIVGMPDLKALQAENPEADFVFLSVDTSEDRWRHSIKKYNLQGDHYFIPNGQKGVFGDFMNSNWIPRYMVIDAKGNIRLFKAKKATDKNIKIALQ